MKVKDLIIMILENKIPYDIQIKYDDLYYTIDDLLETYKLSWIAEKYVSIIYEGSEELIKYIERNMECLDEEDTNNNR